MAELTARQAKFCIEYLIDLNGTQAAIRAGYAVSGARTEASRLLANADITEELNRLRLKIAETTQITPERIMQEYARIGFSDLRKALTPSGQLIDPQDWDDDTAAAISSLEVVTGSKSGAGDENSPIEYTHKIKVWDKPKALDAMAKHLGMFDGKKGVDDPEEPAENANLRALGRKLAYVLSGATEGA
jgi:phage terminase small subunit